MLNLREIKSSPVESNLKNPTRLGYFSCTNNTTIHHNDSAKKIHIKPNEKLILPGGYLSKLDRKQPQNSNGIHPSNDENNGDPSSRVANGLKVLSWILHEKKCVIPPENIETSNNSNKISADFVCDSHVLELIMETPPNLGTSWTIIAVKFNGVIYLTSKDVPFTRGMGERRLMKTDDEDPYYIEVQCNPDADKQLSKLITMKLDVTIGDPDTDYSNDTFHLVNTIQINKFNVLYSAKVDCVASSKQLSRPIRSSKVFIVRASPDNFPAVMRSFFQRSWWISCAITSANKVLFGCMDKNNEIRKLFYVRPRDILKNQDIRSPNVCSKFLESTLKFMKMCVEAEMVPIGFHRDGIEKEIIPRQLNESPFTFLPSWYTTNTVVPNHLN